MIRDDTLLRVAEQVAAVPGIAAVALGGSRARGTHHPDSDVDLGLYYDAAALDLPALHATAAEIVGAPVDVAGPGGWGPWVDGGAWLRVDGTPVDLILRDVDRVRAQRDRAIRGEFAFHTQLGHPLGFLDVAYAGEAASCRPLIDPGGVIAALREGLDPYPPALRDALAAQLENAEFLLGGAAKVLGRGDTAYLQLCCTTVLLWCAHAWHAEVGVWATNEKGLVPAVAGLAIDSGDFSARAAAALAGPAPDHAAVTDLVTQTRRRLAARRATSAGGAHG
jgi:predicted nucleotidyltransferase